MRETYQPPTTSPTGPPHDHTHPRHSRNHTRTPSSDVRARNHTHPHHSHSLPRTPSSDVRARNHTHSRHSRTLPRHSHSQPRHSHSQPHHSRTHSRHSRVGGNPPRCVQTPEETALLPPSTKFDKNRQNPTRFHRNSCTRAREATAFHLPSLCIGLRPARNGFEVSLGATVSYASRQYIERSRLGHALGSF